MTSDDVSKKKKNPHIWLKVSKNGLISSLKDQYSSFNIHYFKRLKCGIKIIFFFLAKGKNSKITTREICYALPNEL